MGSKWLKSSLHLEMALKSYPFLHPWIVSIKLSSSCDPGCSQEVMETKLIAFKMLNEVFSSFEWKGHSRASKGQNYMGLGPRYCPAHLEHFTLPSFTRLSSLPTLLEAKSSSSSCSCSSISLLIFSSCSSSSLSSSSFLPLSHLPLLFLFSSPPPSLFLFFLLLPPPFLFVVFTWSLLWDHSADWEPWVLLLLPPKCCNCRCVCPSPVGLSLT